MVKNRNVIQVREKHEMKNISSKAKKQKPNNSDIYTSPSKKHNCTDIICSVLLILFILVLVLLSIFAYINGNPSDLILPHDSFGRICGKSKGLEEKQYLFFFDLTRCLSALSALNGCPTRQVCVDECPTQNAYEKIPSNQPIIAKYCDPFNNTICPSYLVKSKPIFGRCVPEVVASVLDNSMDILEAFDSVNNLTIPIQTLENGILSDLTSKKLKEAIKYLKNLIDLKKAFEVALEDFSKSYWLILIALSVAAVISFVWLLLLRFVIKPIIYLTILAVLGLLAFGTYFSVQEYLDLKNRNQSNQDFKLEFEKIYDLNYLKDLKETWLALSIIFGVLFLILFLIILFLRKRIQLAVDIIKEVSRAVISIPSSLIWPVIPFLLELGIIVYCVSISLFLASSGIQLFKIVDMSSNLNQTKISNQLKIGDYCLPAEFESLKITLNNSDYDFYECYFYKYGFNTTLPFSLNSQSISTYYTKAIELLNNFQWLPQVYVLFMLFWLSAFMIGLNEMTLAGSFGAWYWSSFRLVKGKEKKNSLPMFTVLGSFGRALFYHFGTIAFGSLLIAIVKLIRVILEFVSNRTKSKADKSKVAKYILCCLKCCFWCLERFIKFLNRYAFIITATYSLNFCKAAKKAFKLVTSNVLRIVVVDKISNFMLFLSNLTITAGIGVFSFYFFTKKIPFDAITAYSPDLNYYILPLLVIILGSFGITKLFFDVFAVGIDSILICVLIDLDENNGSKEQPYFMSKNLRKTLKITNRI